eukprot:7004897-Lingulodinium_polyedra.AAC.1
MLAVPLAQPPRALSDQRPSRAHLLQEVVPAPKTLFWCGIERGRGSPVQTSWPTSVCGCQRRFYRFDR